MGLSEENVRDFWYRGNGWPGKATAIDKSGQSHEMSYQDSWGRILSKGVNFRCKICPDGFGEFADISCGDAWFEKDGMPIFDEKPGRSLAFIRSNIGRRIFDAAKEAGYLVAEPFDVDRVKAIQRSQYHRKIHIGIRLLALKLTGDRLVRFSGFYLFSNLRKARFSSVLRDFAGTLRRSLAARRGK
jgi:coenzyme F420 hydrogenase subunit beta